MKPSESERRRVGRPGRDAPDYRVKKCEASSAGEGQWGALVPGVGADAERLDEALPARGEREGRAQLEDLALVEVPAQLRVEGVVDLGPLAREAIGQAQGGHRAGRQRGLLEVTERLLHLVLPEPLAHQRCAAREASVHAPVALREPDAAELEHGRIEARAARVDERHPREEQVEHRGPAREREEQVVVRVGLGQPHPEAPAQRRLERRGIRLGQPAVLVGHAAV